MRYMNNKKGEIVLRDVVFFLFIFIGIISFSSILVTEMGTEYDNPTMVSDYNHDAIGKTELVSTSKTWENIATKLSGEHGLIQMVDGALDAIVEILKEVILAPVTFATILTSILEILNASTEVILITKFFISGLLYIIIIFGIVKVFLKGGTI